jgi:hypothetical protein
MAGRHQSVQLDVFNRNRCAYVGVKMHRAATRRPLQGFGISTMPLDPELKEGRMPLWCFNALKFPCVHIGLVAIAEIAPTSREESADCGNVQIRTAQQVSP